MNNVATAESAGIFITFSTISIDASTFNTTSYPDGANSPEQAVSSILTSGHFISISAGVQLTLTDSNFENGYALTGGCIYISGSSTITITNNTFSNSYGQNTGGAIYASSFKALTVRDSTFTANVAYTDGSEMYATAGSITVLSTSFSVTPNFNAISLITTTFEGTSLTFTNSDLSASENTNDITGGGIYVQNPLSFILTSSSFQELTYTHRGGAIYMEMTDNFKEENIPNSPSWTITSCTFTSNAAKFGGAIYVNSVNYALIRSSTFTNNTAVLFENEGGEGGGLYYESDDNISQVVFESGNSFTSNYAQSSGGALFWIYNQPKNISLASYTSNIASSYGNNYGCFAQALQNISESQYNSLTNNRRSLQTNQFSVSDQQSGAQMSPIYLALFDEFGQIVGSDSTSTVTISIDTTNVPGDYSPTLTGVTTVTAVNGLIKFENLVFTAHPGYNFSLEFTSTGIDESKPSNIDYLNDNNLANTSLQFSLGLRECVQGEAFETTGACVACLENEEYSLSTSTSPQECKECQKTRMYWRGGSDIGPRPGFWRSSTSSDNFIECLYKPACLGYVSPSNNNLGECFTGYQGILWADCEVGFSRTGQFEWDKCPNPLWNIIRLILILIAVIVAIVVIIRSTLASASQRKNVQSVYIKLLMNHLQLLILTSSFEFDWPSRVVKLFETSEPVARVSTQVMSFDWFLDQRSENDDGSTQSDGNLIRLYYQKMIMYALLPLVLALGSFTFWTLYFCGKSKSTNAEKVSRIMATLIILFFLVHPSIVEYMFSNFK